MAEEKETFRVFKDAPAAKDLAQWLGYRDIEADIKDTSGYFDPSFASSILNREWAVRLAPGDFSQASALLHQFYSERLDGIPTDYYLFSFTDDELEGIISKPDEWGDLDYELAKQLLRERGKTITDTELEAIRASRYDALSAPEIHDAGSVIGWGYGLALIGGFIGSLIGWHLSNSLKVLPDGKKVPRYDPAAQAHGKRIFWIGAIVTALFVGLRMYVSYQRGIGNFFRYSD